MIRFTLILFLFTMLFSCSDSEFDYTTSAEEVEYVNSEAYEMTIEKAQQIFYGNSNNEVNIKQFQSINAISESECYGNNPFWYLSQSVTISNGNKLLVVPVDVPIESNMPGVGAQLIFYEDSSCDFPYTFIWYEGTSDVIEDGRPTKLSNSEFTGHVYTLNYCNGSSGSFELANGKFKGFIEKEFTGYDCAEEVIEKGFFSWLRGLFCGGVKCPSAAGQKPGFFQAVGSWLSSIFDGGGGDSGVDLGSIITHWGGIGDLNFPDEGGDDNDGGGVTDPYVENIFNDPIFNGEGLTVHQILTRIISENNYNICPGDLHDILHECLEGNFDSGLGFASGGESNSNGSIAFDMDNYIRLLGDPDALNECLESATVTHVDINLDEHDVEVLCAIKQFFPEDEVQEIFSIINDECGDTYNLACQFAQLYCLDRLREFKERYNVSMSFTDLYEIRGLACHASDEEFDDEVMRVFLMSEFQVFNEPGNPCEKELIRQNPLAAFDVYLNAQTAKASTDSKFEGQNLDFHLDCVDAYRHAYWNALNTISLGRELAAEFGDAHECNGSINDAKMDYFNNEIGRRIGSLWNEAPNAALEDNICSHLEQGLLRVLENEDDTDSPLINSINCNCN